MRWPWDKPEEAPEQRDSVLCIDIGGTRIKSAIVPKPASLEALNRLDVRVIQAERWLNHTLPDILNPYSHGSVLDVRGQEPDFDRVAVCIGSQIRESDQAVLGAYFLKKGIPSDLAVKLGERTAMPVDLLNDSWAWAKGFELYASLGRKKIHLPALVLVFGTGVACAWIEPNGRVTPREFQSPFRPTTLARASGVEGAVANDVHRILGGPFFAYASRAQQRWDEGRTATEFTDRVAALVADTSQQWGRPGSILIGGGRAGHVLVDRLRAKAGVPVLTSVDVAGKKSSDLIPLLGASQYSIAR